MFITIEDETGIANLVICSKLYEKQRRILSVGLMAVNGRMQREGEVVHLDANQLSDLSRELARSANATPRSRCLTDVATSSTMADRVSTRVPYQTVKINETLPRDGEIAAIEVKTRDFR